MPNKKPQINPFAMYMREQEPLLRRRGIQFDDKKDLVSYLYPHFNSLPPLEKEKYKNLAKQEKERAKQDLSRKYDDRGVPLSQCLAEEEEERQKQLDMIQHVGRMVHDRPSGDSLLNATFYTLFTTLRCYTDDGKASVYIPCELGMSEWTLADGLVRSCSYIIEPDAIPVGYKSRCLDLARDTHQVPLGLEQAERSLPGLWIRLKNFINPQESLDEYPPVFTLSEEIQETEACLEWLHLRSMDRRDNPLRVYSLERLLLELFEASGGEQLETACADMLRRGHFDYLTDLACPFHQELENPRFCALSMARRHVYIVLDHVAGRFGLDLVPGRHVPSSRCDGGVVVNTRMLPDVVKPVPFRPGRDTEPDFPSEYKLIQPAQSRFAGVGWDTAEVHSAGGGGEGRHRGRGQEVGAGARPRAPATRGLAAQLGRGRPSLSQDAPPLPEDEFPSLGGRGRAAPGKGQAKFSEWTQVIGRGRGTSRPARPGPGGFTQ